MKNLFSNFMSWFAGTPSSQVEPKVEGIDPNKILFSLPTIAADELEFVMPTREEFERAPQFHEDDWAQLEFFPQARLDEVKEMMLELNVFEQQHRMGYGWKKIYSRHIHRFVFPDGGAVLAALEESNAIPRLPSPILTTSSTALGQVKGGFSIRLPGPLLLYGIDSESGISVLAARMETGCDDMKLTDTFVSLNRSNGLIFVDWPGQMVLASTNASGEINIWRP